MILNTISIIYVIIYIPLLVTLSIRRISLGIALIMMSLPIFSVFRRYFINDQPAISFETISVFVLFIIVLFKEKYAINNYKMSLLKYLLVYIFFSFLSTIYATNNSISIKILLNGVISPFLIYVITIVSIKNVLDIRNILIASVIMVLIILSHFVLNITSRGINIEDINNIYNTSPLSNIFVVPSIASTILLMILPVILYMLNTAKRYSLFLLVMIFIIVLEILFTMSRGSWLTLLMIMGMTLFLYKKRVNIKLIVFSGILFLLINYLETTRIFNGIIEYRINNKESTSIYARYSNYLLSINSIKTHYLTGFGLGNYINIYKEYSDISNKIPKLIFAHSLFLTLIVEIGLIGTIALFVFIMGHIKRIITVLKKRQNRLLSMLLVSIVAFLIIASTTGIHVVAYFNINNENTYFMSPTMIVLNIILGIVYQLTTEKYINEKSKSSFYN